MSYYEPLSDLDIRNWPTTEFGRAGGRRFPPGRVWEDISLNDLPSLVGDIVLGQPDSAVHFGITCHRHGRFYTVRVELEGYREGTLELAAVHGSILTNEIRRITDKVPAFSEVSFDLFCHPECWFWLSTEDSWALRK